QERRISLCLRGEIFCLIEVRCVRASGVAQRRACMLGTPVSQGLKTARLMVKLAAHSSRSATTRSVTMAWRPDPTFYPSPRMAMRAPPERRAWAAAFDANAALKRPGTHRHDGLATVDVDPASKTYSQIVALSEVPTVGDQLHHSGWNACSASLCP